MKKALLGAIAFVVISGILFGREPVQITSFDKLKNALDKGKIVSVKVTIDHSEKNIKEIGYHILHFMYDGENLHTSREIVIPKNSAEEVKRHERFLGAFTTFNKDGSVTANVVIFDPETKKETTETHSGVINKGKGDTQGNVYLYARD